MKSEFCGSCNKGWWCMGCGRTERATALDKYLTNKDLIEDIKCVRLECGILVPCYICNKNGKLNCNINTVKLPDYWRLY